MIVSLALLEVALAQDSS